MNVNFLMLQSNGQQHFRVSLPIEKMGDYHSTPAADGQLGGIIKIYREWRICGNRNWLNKMWEPMRNSMNFCIKYWDPNNTGLPIEPQHNTYDITFLGHNGMIASFYLGALKAIVEIGKELDKDIAKYAELLEVAEKITKETLFNGEYFIQKTEWKSLNSPPLKSKDHWYAYESHEDKELLEKEGPKYQYGKGCLSDGVIGAWLAEFAGLEDVMDSEQTISHLKSIYKYNYKTNLLKHANVQRPHYALGKEGGLLLCTWENDDKTSLPFVYSDEVWTGIEYQVASHLIKKGLKKEGLEIVKTVRERYNGTKRNPFDEMECGHFYARAMSSYALLEAYSGVSYDARTKTMTINSSDKDCKYFFSTDSGWGNVGLKNGKPFCDVIEGEIEIKEFVGLMDCGLCKRKH